MQALSVLIHSLAPLISLTNESTNMKQINLATGLPFKHGDKREDGYIFVAHKTNKKNKQGFYQLKWASPIAFKKQYEKQITKAKQRLTTNHGRAQSLVNAAKKRAKVSIELKWVVSVLEKGVCQLSGLPFDLHPTKETYLNPYAPSLDRIDFKKGYTPKNTRVVLSAVNSTLNQFGEKTMLPILKAMVNAIEKNIL